MYANNAIYENYVFKKEGEFPSPSSSLGWVWSHRPFRVTSMHTYKKKINPPPPNFNLTSAPAPRGGLPGFLTIENYPI